MEGEIRMLRRVAFYHIAVCALAGCSVIVEIDFSRINEASPPENFGGTSISLTSGGMGIGGQGGETNEVGGGGGMGTMHSASSSGHGGMGGGDGGGPIRPASCAPDTPGADWKCGWQRNADCCGAIAIDGGTFNRGNDPAFPATVSPFVMDVYEITVGRFRAFVDAGMGTVATAPAQGAGAPRGSSAGGWREEWNSYLAANTEELRNSLLCEPTYGTFNPGPLDNERNPMNCMTWYEAYAFCIWDGGRLPTEAEWNFVAAHGPAQAMYPWGGSFITAERAVYQCSGDGSAPYECTDRDIDAVGARPSGASFWGHHDLAGNVWEWTLDLSATYKNPCIDCVNLDVGVDHIVRGGGFSDSGADLRSYIRYAEITETRSFAIGARCVKEP